MTEEPAEGGVEVTPQDAQRLIAQDRAARIKRVEDGLQHLLAQNNCALDVQMSFSMMNQPRGRVVIIPRD